MGTIKPKNRCGRMLAILVLGLVIWPATVSPAAPMGTAFTYQGRLIDTNQPADGIYDFKFKLYNAQENASQIGSAITIDELDVTEGCFTVELDFGSGVFDGNARWLEIGIRPGEQNDPNVYTTLTTRHELTPTPYAIYAQSAQDTVTLGGNDISDLDSRYVNEGQSNSISTAMIQDGAVTYPKLANPLNIDSNVWNWNITTGELSIAMTSSYRAINIENSSSGGWADCMWLKSTSVNADSETAVLYACTYKGKAGYFEKKTNDGQYALFVYGAGPTSEGLFVYGNTVATGFKGAAVKTSRGQEAIFCVEAPEVEIYCSGTARLTAGSAHVVFDRLFTEAISPEVEVRVTVTAVGAWSGLYVGSANTEGFDVRSGAGDQNVKFNWMACGRRKGYETRPNVTTPDEAEEKRIRDWKETPKTK